jgi:hypothetical protein
VGLGAPWQAAPAQGNPAFRITANVVTFVIRFLIFNYLIFVARATTPARG